MNKQKILFVLLAVLVIVSAAVIISSDKSQKEKKPATFGPVAVSFSDAVTWAATRMPGYFWISPGAGEELRIDTSAPPGGDPAVAFGLLGPEAQRAVKKAPLAFTYLVQSFLVRRGQMKKLEGQARRAAVYQTSNRDWSAYVLPRVRGGKEIPQVRLFAKKMPVVGNVLNGSRKRTLPVARQLIKRVRFVYPPNG